MSKIPVIEFFGPTIQGEGLLIGHPTFFLRTGGCDYRCTKCDSLHAVDEFAVKRNATWWNDEALAKHISTTMHEAGTRLITLSGGNPAMWDLEYIVRHLHSEGIAVAIETQGTVFKPWIALCDYITVSPKGPSMIPGGTPDDVLLNFLDGIIAYTKTTRPINLKVPVFNPDDLDYALNIYQKFVQGRNIPFSISVGNDDVPEASGLPTEDEVQSKMAEHREALLKRLDDIIQHVFKNPKYAALQSATFLPQLHVLMYGNKGGV